MNNAHISPSRTSCARRIATALGVGSLVAGAAVVGGLPASAATAPAPAPQAAVAAAPSQASRALVAGWYFQFLGRDAAKDQGSAYWVGQLDTGADPTSVLQRFFRSDEYVINAVTAIYRAYLNTPPNPGAQYWIGGVERGDFPLEWVEQNVAASPAYLRRTGAARSANDVAVEGWYSVVLERAPSLGERAYWGGRIDQAGSLQAFRELWYTPEAVSARIQSHYSTALGRAAGAGEVGYWYQPEVASDITVKARIATSAEFSARFGG